MGSRLIEWGMMFYPPYSQMAGVYASQPWFQWKFMQKNRFPEGTIVIIAKMVPKLSVMEITYHFLYLLSHINYFQNV